MIVSICNNDNFILVKEISKSVFDVSWGKEHLVISDNEVCSFVVHRFFQKPNSSILRRCYNESERIPSMSEMKAHGEFIGMTSEQMIPWMKEQMKRAIAKYDKSKAVENFTINGVDVWMDKETRTGLLLRFQSEKAAGKTETVLWHNGMNFPLVIDDAIQMLYAIEVYASASYDNTQRLLAEVDALESVDELLLFDFKQGYPKLLSF